MSWLVSLWRALLTSAAITLSRLPDPWLALGRIKACSGLRLVPLQGNLILTRAHVKKPCTGACLSLGTRFSKEGDPCAELVSQA